MLLTTNEDSRSSISSSSRSSSNSGGGSDSDSGGGNYTPPLRKHAEWPAGQWAAGGLKTCPLRKNMPPRKTHAALRLDTSGMHLPDGSAVHEKHCEGCDDMMPLHGSRYCSICGTFWADLQAYMYCEVLRDEEVHQFKRFGDLQEFRARAVGQWKKSASHVAFAAAMKLLMLEILRGRQKEAKNSEEKDEQEDEDGEDMHRWEESSPLVTRTS